MNIKLADFLYNIYSQIRDIHWSCYTPTRFLLYKKTKDFNHLMALFCDEMETVKIMQGLNTDYFVFSSELLILIETHFREALEAKSDNEARKALGVGKSKGGPAQRRTAKNEYDQAQVLNLVDSLENGLFNVETQNERFELAANLTGYKKGSVKTLFHANRRKQK